MNFRYTEKKVSLPGNVHSYAEKKVTKLQRYFSDEADALVAFSVEKNRNKVEITVHGANTYFRASESTSDMFASIDACISSIERQIRKIKQDLKSRSKAKELRSLIPIFPTWRKNPNFASEQRPSL